MSPGLHHLRSGYCLIMTIEALNDIGKEGTCGRNGQRNVHCLSSCYWRKMAARCYLKLGWHLTLTKKSAAEAIGEKDANFHDEKVSKASTLTRVITITVTLNFL